MNDLDFRVAELALKGLSCSHILLQVGLDAQGLRNPALMRAMSGLASGMGSGLACGALSAGCCLIALYAGADGDGTEAHERLPLMLEEYTEWFLEEIGQRHGGIDCRQIIHDDPRLKARHCPALILAAVHQARDILAAHGFELDGVSGDAQGVQP